MTENIRRLMIIDKYNHKSIRSCKTYITYNTILYENDGILFNIQIYGYINKDNIFGLCFGDINSKYYLIKIDNTHLYKSIEDAILCHYYKFCLSISGIYLLLMYKLYIGDIYFNFVICIHEINKLFYLSLELCNLCKSYSYGVYNKICSLCYDNNYK